MSDEPLNATDASRGDRDVFELFYRTNYSFVSRFVLRRVPIDSHDEVVASTFIVAWKKFASTETPSLPWLYRIAGYEIAHERRRFARSLKTAELSEDHVGVDDPSSKIDVLRQALRELSERDIELLRLVVLDELSREDAALVLGCSVDTLNVRLHRARTRLANTVHRLENTSSDIAHKETKGGE